MLKFRSLGNSLERLRVDVVEKEVQVTLNRLQREYVHQDQMQEMYQALDQGKADSVRMQTLEQKVDRLAAQISSLTNQVQGK
jgi:ATP-dependent Lon protease